MSEELSARYGKNILVEQTRQVEQRDTLVNESLKVLEQHQLILIPLGLFNLILLISPVFIHWLSVVEASIVHTLSR